MFSVPVTWEYDPAAKEVTVIIEESQQSKNPETRVFEYDEDKDLLDYDGILYERTEC